MAYSVGSVKLSKWQLALILGAPLAVGLGMYVLKKSTGDKLSPEERKQTKSKKTTSSGKPTLEKQPLSLDGTATDKELERKKKSAELGEKLSPLKEATNYKNEGNNCYRSGKYDEAINFYDKAIDKCPKEQRTDLAIFHQNRAAAYEMLRKWNKVKDDCSRSLEYNPRYAKAYYRRARAHEATSNISDCLDDVTATCILEMFQNNNTIMFADRVLKETGRIDAEKGMKDRKPVIPSEFFVRTYLRSFIADPLQTMTPPQTEASVDQLATSSAEGNAVATATAAAPLRGFWRARQALDEQKYDEVIPACTEEIESSESESQFKVEALLLRGTFYLLSSSYKESKNDFDAIINNADADVTLRAYAFMKRSSLLIQLDEREKGLADFDEAQKLAPNNPDLYHQRAQILLLLEQIEAAVRDFEKAVSLAPNHAIAAVQNVYAKYRLMLLSGDHNRLENVVQEFSDIIARFPDCVDAFSVMAQVLSDQQRFEEADTYYTKALALAPDNPMLLVHYAIMMLQWRGAVETAVTYLKNAIEVDNKCELAYETLGTLEVQRANLQGAIELFEQAIIYAKSQAELVHVYSLRNAAKAQINVMQKLGIDMNSVSALAQQGIMGLETK